TRLRDLLVTLLDRGTKPYVLLLQVDLGPWSPWGRLMRISREVDEILFAEIARRRAERSSTQTDVLSMLVAARDQNGQPMTDRELRDEMFTLLVAGHETTATSLAWAFHRLLGNPDALERTRDELQRVTGGGALKPSRVASLEYLAAVVKETLRLNPILPIVGRRLTTPMRIGGRALPAGGRATPCISLTHRRPDIWPNPARFDPTRFLGLRPSPYTFLPFGGGVRRCLGMAFALYEMKVVLA